jgi:hypothetical protein
MQHRGATLRGNVCTIRLQLIRLNGEGHDHWTESLSNDFLKVIEAEIKKSIPESLGPEFKMTEFAFHKNGVELLIKIGTDYSEISSYVQLTRSIKMLVSHLRTLLAWLVGSRASHVMILGRWSPEPALILLRSQTEEKQNTLLKQLQQPLGLLILGTLLGSLLVPYLNDLSNRRKVRHEERIKMALSIVEQNDDTDRRLFNLMEYLVLFRKDHTDPSETPAELKLQQTAAKKTFNDLYLSFNGQAWWWYWGISSESSLSALATNAESQRIAQLAHEYGSSLSECTDPIAKVWDRFLKHPFNPKDPENDQVISQAREALKNARTRRNQAAIQMAQLLAGE